MRALIALSFVLMMQTVAHAQGLSAEEKKEGFVDLSDPKLWNDSEGWTAADGALKKGPKSRALISPKRYKDFVLRLEWRDGFKPLTQIEFGGGRPAKLPMAMADLMKVARPPGEWNELEISVKDQKADARMNGQQIFKGEDVHETVPGPILLIPGEEAVAFRNIRVRELAAGKGN